MKLNWIWIGLNAFLIARNNFLLGQYETDEKDKTLIEEHDAFDKNVLKSFTKNRAFKTRHKLKAHTSKIVSSFKTPSISCSLVKDYKVS